MVLTKDFKETVQKRALKDSEFRKGLLTESVLCFLANDMTTGKTLLRDYINATIGFEKLAQMTRKSSKSLMRMFGAKGNPSASNLFPVIDLLLKREEIQFEANIAKKLSHAK